MAPPDGGPEVRVQRRPLRPAARPAEESPDGATSASPISPDEPSEPASLLKGYAVVEDTAEGLRYFASLLRRRWLAPVVGLLIGLVAGTIAAAASPQRYVAERQFLIEQPGLTANVDSGKSTADKLTVLMPTIADLATSDDVLDGIRNDLRLRETVAALRSHVSASVVFQTLDVRVRVKFSSSSEANAVADAFSPQFQARVARLGETGGTDRILATPTRRTAASPQGRGPLKTIALAGILGSGFIAIAAFVLRRA
jgi:capsular polysaccharide biosynthesis protein